MGLGAFAILALGIGSPAYTFNKLFDQDIVITPQAGFVNTGALVDEQAMASINNNLEAAFRIRGKRENDNGYGSAILFRSNSATPYMLAAQGQVMSDGSVVTFDNQYTTSFAFSNATLIADKDPQRFNSSDEVAFNCKDQMGNYMYVRWNTSELALKHIFPPTTQHYYSNMEIAKGTGDVVYQGYGNGIDGCPFFAGLSQTPFTTRDEKSDFTSVFEPSQDMKAIAYYDFTDQRYEVKDFLSGSSRLSNMVFPQSYGPGWNDVLGVPSDLSNGCPISTNSSGTGYQIAFNTKVNWATLLLLPMSADGLGAYDSATNKYSVISKVGDLLPYYPAIGNNVVYGAVTGFVDRMSIAGSGDVLFEATVWTGINNVYAIYEYNINTGTTTLICNTRTKIPAINSTMNVQMLRIAPKAITDDGDYVIFTYTLSNGTRGVARARRN